VNVAVIPARGGSKRLPRKNIREFAGQPMIAYAIQCALRSGVFDRVIVSTDDEEIARVAAQHGAEVPFVRPARLADDYAGTTEVMAHAVDWLQQKEHNVEAVCCLYATAPFMRTEDVVQGLELLQSGRWQFVFAATSFAYPVWRSFRVDPSGGLRMLFPEHFVTRSQDLPEVLHDAGQFYWGLPAAWLGGARIFDQNSTVVPIPHWRVQDIDSEADWTRAELMAASLLSTARDTHGPIS
jgi:pseudaminic acid cytidylyltransferase